MAWLVPGIDDFGARFPYGPPSLVECERLTVRGDVTFGAGVVCRGDVQVSGAATGRVGVPDGAELTSEVELA